MSKCMYAPHGCLNDAVPDFRMCARCQDATRGSGGWKLLRVGPQWTTEPPTEPGWYWAFDARDKRCVMLEVWSWSGEVCYCFVHDNGSTTEIESHGAYQWQDFSHFMRIEPPEVPE